jgi:hypothetical protein
MVGEWVLNHQLGFYEFFYDLALTIHPKHKIFKLNVGDFPTNQNSFVLNSLRRLELC